jgi:hypothetical protein
MGLWAGTALATRLPLTESAAAESAAPGPATGPLRTHPENRRYFADASGRAVYLTGSHTWPSVVDHGPSDPPPKFDFAAYLDFLARYGHNFTRLWTWELTSWDARSAGGSKLHTAQPHPFARTGPGEAQDGKPKFDLGKLDPAYFDRLRSRVEAAGRRGIYASVMLFEGWGLQFVTDAWKRHPFHPDNNVNGIGRDVAQGVDIHTLKHPKIVAVHEAYARKVVDTLNGLDNVLYEISNENHPPSTEWQYHVIRLLKDYERTKAKQHPVGMTFQYKGGSNKTLFASPADWISPNPEGGYRDDPPAADGRKVIVNDTDHLWGLGGNAPWVWKSFLRGMNPIFMDPYDGLVLGEKFEPKYEPVRKALGVTLRVAREFDLAAMTPRNELASSRYCLAGQGKRGMEYVVYVPKGVEVAVNLADTQGKLTVKWLDPVSGTGTSCGQADAGGKRTFALPRPGNAVLLLQPSRRNG